jgi:hypothetical protein
VTPDGWRSALREKHPSVTCRPVGRPATPAHLKEDCVEVRETSEQLAVELRAWSRRPSDNMRSCS